MSNKHIFIVDDEPHICELVKYNLEKNLYTVEVFYSAEEMFGAIGQRKPDMILLDLMLPDMDGLAATRRLRADRATEKIPVIMLTAKNEELDRVIGLELGADDYISKPFSVRELLARMKVIFRRAGASDAPDSGDVIEAQDLIINNSKHMITRGGEVFKLTLKEYELIRILARNKGRVLSRDVLLDRVWGYDYYGATRTIDVHIRHIRKILNDEGEKYIETVRGVGYRFRE
jgi:two-component system alkaline phosphatase synthesis response regulator PhoP